jgi:hypothetical protein
MEFGDSRVDDTIWGRLVVEPAGCWIWTGCSTNKGAGIIVRGGKRERVHRHVFAIANGKDLAARRHLESKCKVVACCNPQHQYLSDVASPHERRMIRQRYRRRVQRQGDAGRRKNRSQHLKGKYGITIEIEDELMKSQSSCCAICLDPFTNTKHRHVDHDHRTGAVRGLLCKKCNLGIGYFDDDGSKLEAAIEYLRARRERDE